MTSDLYFRIPTADDFDAVLTLSNQLARHIEAPEPPLTPAQFVARYVGPEAPMRLRLAVIGERVVGLIAWTVTHELYSGDSRLYISDLIVDGTARGHGVGGALMAEVTAWARQRGIAKLGWEVWHRNTTAMAFYEGLGALRDREALSYVLELSA